MALIARGILRVLAILLTVTSPIIAHLVLTHSLLTPGQRVALTYLLILVQAGVVLSMILTRTTRLVYRVAAVGVVAAGVALCFYHLAGGLILSSGVLHASA